MTPRPIWFLRDYEPGGGWQTTWLYRLFAEDGELLYIGVTRRYLWDRVINHLRKPWGGQVWGFTLEPFPKEYLALAAEVAAIKAERPRHNLRSVVPDGS